MFLKNIMIASLSLAMSVTAFAQAPKKTQKKAKTAAEKKMDAPKGAPATDMSPMATPAAMPESTPSASAEHHDAMAAAPMKGIKSIYFLQNAGSQQSALLRLRYETHNIDASQGGTTVTNNKKGSATYAEAEYEYGIDDMFSAGLGLGYQVTGQLDTTSGSTTATIKQTGLEDLMLFAKGNSQMGDWALHYGLGFGLSLGKRKVTVNSATDFKADSQSGGLSLMPYVGATWKLSETSLLGAKVSYTWLGERTVTSDTTALGGTTSDTKLTNGSSWSVVPYYEYEMEHSAINVHVGVLGGAQTTATDSTGTATTGWSSDLLGTFKTNYNASSPAILFGGSGSMYLSKDFLLTLGYDGAKVPDLTPTDTASFPTYTAFLVHQVWLQGKWYF